VIEGRFIPAERMLPTVGGQLGRVVDRALAHDPADRFESAADFAAALQRELERLGFETPYAELTQYLNRPARYSLEFPDRIVARLVAAAEKARNDGDVMLSSSLFNRALAYKPHDSDLIAAVARIAKQRAISRRWRKIGLSFAVFAGVGLLGIGTLKIYESAALRRHLPPKRPSHDAPKPTLTSNSIVAATDSSERAMPQSSDTPVRAKSVSSMRAPSRRGESGTSSAVDTRPVQIVITGASGSRLLIDGAERTWFGVRHELSLGPHRFEVQPPNDTCCVPPQPKVVEVVRGPAEQKVMLAIEFREATLFAQGPSGATLICGELFPGSLSIPGKRTVRVTKAETRANCTLLPQTGSTERPKTVDVVLRPGDTFTVSG